MYVSVLERGLGRVLGVNGVRLPLPTRPQRYRDPASLVTRYFVDRRKFPFRIDEICKSILQFGTAVATNKMFTSNATLSKI